MKTRNMYTRILKYMKPHKKYLAGSLLLASIYGAANALNVPLSRDIFDIISKLNAGNAKDNIGLFSLFVGYVVILRLLQMVCKFFQTYLMSYVSQRIIIDMRIEVYQNIQSLSMDFFKKWRMGDIIARVFTDINQVQSALITNFTKVFPEVINLIGVMGYIIYLNWQLAMATLIVVPFMISVIDWFGKRMKLISGKVQRKNADIVSLLQEALSAIFVVKSFNMEQHEIKKFTRHNEKNFKLSMKGIRFDALRSPVIELLQFTAITMVIWFGGYQVYSGTISGPELGAFFVGVMLLINPVISLSQGITSTEKAMASAKRVFLLIDIEPSVKEVKNPVVLENVQGEVEFRNVSFYYEKSEGEVLKNVNVRVSSGEVIALVGASGSGKSTFVNLIPRFYDPTEGEICIDGKNIKECQIFSLRRHIAIVPQESILFSGSIRDNIAYGSPDASQEEIEEAARRANAYEFITDLKYGFHTKVGERGTRLSGGQKQRIAIARALMRNPRILILDEATSSLDTESERLVQEALNTLMEGRTSFVIAHRLSTIVHADRILVFDKGSIVETGTHQELMRISNGYYQKLYNLQFASKQEHNFAV